MSTGTISRLLTAPLAMLLASCATSASGARQPGEFRKGQTSFFNEGSQLILGLDTRSSRITGPAEFLPVQVVVLNRQKATLGVDRESFSLVRPDGMQLPAASPQEWRRDYHRARADLRIGMPFLDNVFGRYPSPPFHWMSIDLFPEKVLGAIPRSGLDLRFSDGTFGYLYFRHPQEGKPAPAGVYKLLMRPRGSEETYVVDFIPYEAKKD